MAGTTFGFTNPDNAIGYCGNSYYFGIAQSFVDPRPANLFLMKLRLGTAKPSFLRVLDSCGISPVTVAVDASGNTWMSGGYSGFSYASSVAIGIPTLLVRSGIDYVQPVVDLSKYYGIPLVAPLAAHGSGFLIEFSTEGAAVPFSTYLPQKTFVALHGSSGVQMALGTFAASVAKEVRYHIDSTSLLKIDSAQVYPIIIQPPVPLSNLTLNGSDLSIGAGEVVEITGQGIGPSTLVTADIGSSDMLPRALAGVTVTFGGIAAPLVSVSATSIVCVVPFALMNSPDQSGIAVQASYNSLTSNSIDLSISRGFRPTISAVLNANGSANSQQNPARPGEIVTLYGSSFGQTSPASQDGQINRLALPLANVISITVGNYSAQILFAGSAPGQVAGVTQVNLLVPTGATPSQQSLIHANGSGVFFPLWVALK